MLNAMQVVHMAFAVNSAVLPQGSIMHTILLFGVASESCKAMLEICEMDVVRAFLSCLQLHALEAAPDRHPGVCPDLCALRHVG